MGESIPQSMSPARWPDQAEPPRTNELNGPTTGPGRIFPRSSSAGRIACAGEPRAAGRHVAVAGVRGVGAHPERIGSVVDGFTHIVIPPGPRNAGTTGGSILVDRKRAMGIVPIAGRPGA
jgi:hypothetical protein